MEMSHKRARVELERAATDSARDLERALTRNEDLLGRIRRCEEREAEAAKNHAEQVEANRALRANLESLGKRLEEREAMLNTANETISGLQDQIRELQQEAQNKDCSVSSKTLDNQALTQQLDVQRRECRDNSGLLKEEVEGLRRKLERMDKTKEELVNMELERERLSEKLQAWENLGLSTGLNISVSSSARGLSVCAQPLSSPLSLSSEGVRETTRFIKGQ